MHTHPSTDVSSPHQGAAPQAPARRRTVMVALAFGALVSTNCTSSSTEFFEGQANDAGVNGDVDQDAATVGRDADVEDEFVLPNPIDPDPATLWVPETGDFILVDDQTGSMWNVRGEAFDGPLAGFKLRQVPSFNAFWFAWSTFYHGSEIWNRDELNEPGAIVADDGCLVPCNEILQACGGGRDCIPALDWDGRDERPVARLVPADDPDTRYLSPTDTILGVVGSDGVPRAYPHNILWWHEIYNDSVDGVDYSVTLCPLTGSGMVFAGDGPAGTNMDFGVSGNLYNSNLVMFDRDGDTFWSQMLFTGVSGPELGDKLTLLPVIETTWQRWLEMYPTTLVISEETGYSRNYLSYPYGNYREDDSDTFRPVNPDFQPTYDGKDLVLGLVGEQSARAYAFVELNEFGDRVVVNDEFESTPIVVVYERVHAMAIPFDARVDGQPLTFSGASAP